MQPADAAPAATEPSAVDAPEREAAAAPVVPQPRTGPGTNAPATPQPDAPAVPHPRPAAETDALTPAAGGAVAADVDEASGGDGPTVDEASGGDRPTVDTAEPSTGLTERERGILAFEQQWWRHAGAKEQAIRDRFELSATRYYQLLNALLDNPAALAAEPVLIGRLRRLRSSRARNRRR